jgi:GT2 family glycosyltransferase
MTRRPPEISVILPVRDAAVTLPRVLGAISRSAFRDFELIAVDDGSTDASAGLLEAPGVDVVLRHDRPLGPWVSRNRAAAAARGRILFFVDADVEVGRNTLGRVRALLPPGSRRAVIGVYAARHPNRGVCSRYKNAWIRHSYLRSAGEVDWFFTAAGAVPRALFFEAGGFDEGFRIETGGGDVDFGRRLVRLGASIGLDERLEVVHWKRFDLKRLMLNDARRAYGWSRLALGSGEPVGGLPRKGLANVSGGFVGGVAFAWAAVALAAVGAVSGALAALAGWAACSARFWTWLARAESPWLAAAAVPLLFLDQLACGLGVARALLEGAGGTASRRPVRRSAPALSDAASSLVREPGVPQRGYRAMTTFRESMPAPLRSTIE